MPLTSCAMTWKSSPHKSPDYPYVAEIDPYILRSNTLESLAKQRAGRSPIKCTITINYALQEAVGDTTFLSVSLSLLLLINIWIELLNI